MSSTNLKVHNVLQCRKRKIEPRPWAICAEKLKFRLVVFEICVQTLTYSHMQLSQYRAPLLGWNNYGVFILWYTVHECSLLMANQHIIGY